QKKAIQHRFDTYISRENKTNFGKLALKEFHSDKRKGTYAQPKPHSALLNLSLMLEQAGMQIHAGAWLMQVTFACVLGLGMACLFTQNVFWTFAGGLAMAGALYLRVVWKRKQRLARFEAQLAQGLEIVGRSLRAGHPLSMGLHMVSTEMPEPIRSEFGRLYYEEQMGLPIEESLKNLSQRVPIVDLNFFVVALLIHRQIGGDLAEILDNLSKIIRDRFKVLGQVKALTAEGRLSGWVLSLLPIFVFSMILLINPDYGTLLFKTDLGRKMIYGAVFLQMIGILFIRKIVNIKV
ncbi:pilus assembly protein TadB, partial [bacterium]|nr:pilus assembly protein TadB [bacterium]